MNFNTGQFCLFDAFGTLFRAGEAGEELRSIAGDKADILLQTWRRKQLEYSWLRNQMRRYVPFGEVIRDALDYSIRLHGLHDDRIPALLLPIFSQPTLMPGAGELIRSLKTKGKTVCILSNGTREMLENGVKKTGLTGLVDHIFSVDDIGIYKPDPAVYQMAVDRLQTTPEEMLFFSSNQWDVSGASMFGLDCVWVNQYGETKEGLPFGNVEKVSSLEECIRWLNG